MFLFFRSQAVVGDRADAQGKTSAKTAELINKVNTITDEDSVVKEFLGGL
jgi:hypothetical protein